MFVLYFSLIYFFVDLLKFHYSVGITCAYAMAVAIHFLLNRSFTFSASKGPVLAQLLKYLVLLVINYITTILTVSLFVEVLISSAYLGACVGIVLTTLSGYIASKYWIFTDTRIA